MSEALNSGIYIGKIRHRRFTPKQHTFEYSLYMILIDLDETEQLDMTFLFGVNKKRPLNFRCQDYNENESEPLKLKQSIIEHAKNLGAQGKIDNVKMLTQIRCFGMYFSPVNFYYCYQQGECQYVLAEVSNTPWNEKHYYLVDLNLSKNRKDFHVSPFMEMEMDYHWKIKPPSNKALVHIENREHTEFNRIVFDATLQLKRQEFNRSNLIKLLIKHPIMTLKIAMGIYWQAFKLFVFKRIAYVPHTQTRGNHGTNN